MLTPDKRYIVVRGRLWRAANPALTEPERARLTAELMAARRQVGVARRRGNAAELSEARAAVDAAKRLLGERGPVWWTDGAPDYNRRLVKNSPYAAWYSTLAVEDPDPISPVMSQRYVALLRGINVGRAKRVRMVELQAAVEAAGFTDVATVLNSGNVVCTGPRRAPDAAREIEEAVAERTGVRARVTVLSGATFRRVLEANPLGRKATDPSRALVAFLREPARAKEILGPLAARSWDPEALAVGDDAAYLWCPQGISRGLLATAVDKALGDGVTMRNWATVTRLQALL